MLLPNGTILDGHFEMNVFKGELPASEEEDAIQEEIDEEMTPSIQTEIVKHTEVIDEDI